MSDESEVSEEVLAEIRRAAFELRRTDPQEAVRVLRKAAAQGGAAAVLAHGALGEIYLEEFGDLDGAEAEFRAVLQTAPGLPAAELGLARTLRESGRLVEADAGFLRALQGFSQDASQLKANQEAGEEIPEGAEEAVLALLEVAVELADLRHEIGRNGSVKVPLDDTLPVWAQRARLFDATDDSDDWVRFHALWARLRIQTGRAAEASVVLAEAEQSGEIPPDAGARLRSEVLEELGELAAALGEAQRLYKLDEEAGRVFEPEDVSHLAGLLQSQGDEPGARTVLQAALSQAEKLLAQPEATPGSPDSEAREALREAAKGYREALGPAAVVGLGLGRR
jgi:tetratricopeptide (TPR) repeat protein